MSLSSINFQKATSNSTAHNNRDSKVTYLLDHDSTNNDHLFIDDFNDRKIDYINQYKKIHNQKMQKSQVDNITKEAVINIEKHHEVDDIKNLFIQLEIELNNFRKERASVLRNENKKRLKQKVINENRIKFNIHEISTHKDEGVFILSDLNIKDLNYVSKDFKWFDNSENDVTNKIKVFRPTKKIFFNNEDKTWYSDSSFQHKFENFDKLQKKYNYHAHVIYSDFDFETAKSSRLNGIELTKMQDITAECLSMQRGVSKKISKVKRLTHGQRKQVSDSIEEEKELALNEINQLEKSKQQNIQHATNLLLDTQNKNEILTSKIELLETQLKELSYRHEDEIKDITEEYESKVKQQQNKINLNYIEISGLKALVYSNSVYKITGERESYKELAENYKNLNLKKEKKYLELVKSNKELNHTDNDEIENIKRHYELKIKEQQNEIDNKNTKINELNTLVYSNLGSKGTGKRYTYKEIYEGHQNSFTSIKGENNELKEEIYLLKERERKIDTKLEEVNNLKEQIVGLKQQVSKLENKKFDHEGLDERRIILENKNYSYKDLQEIMDDEKNKYNDSFNEFENYKDDDLYKYYDDEDEGISPNW